MTGNQSGSESASAIRLRHGVLLAQSRRQFHFQLGALLLVIGYLIFALFAFNVPELISNMRPERGVLLATDSFAHKYHVVKRFRTGEVEVSLEGTRDHVYRDSLPEWVTSDGQDFDVDLGDGYRVTSDGMVVTLQTPEFGDMVVLAHADGVSLDAEQVPDWVRISERKFDARPKLFKRVQVSRSKVEVHRYFRGWENFLFDFNSPLNGKSLGELGTLAFSDERLNQDLPNWRYILQSIWGNKEWQHRDVYRALLETVIMALLGTLVASVIALPLAFVAARNFNPDFFSRMAVRRLFDFLRGIDTLIWSLIFIRAFGLGPLTGIMAIVFTMVGELGKLYSEAAENINLKQVDGVAATGAGKTQRYLFGVLPQILPVFTSQTLYYLESNTRSATIIGALGAGGIGLLLVQTIQTAKDWENTLYLIILTLLVVIAMDLLSGWLRKKLIRQ